MENVNITPEDIAEEHVEKEKVVFYQYRGVPKCLSAGISFITDNFFYLLKTLFPVMALLTIVCSAYVFISTDYSNTQHLAARSLEGFRNLSVSLAVLGVLMFVLESAFVGMLYKLIYLHSKGREYLKENMLSLMKRSWRDMLKSLGWNVITYIITSVVLTGCLYLALRFTPYPGLRIVQLVAAGCIFLIFMVAMIPYQLTLPNLMLSKLKFGASMKDGFVQGWKVWGKMFGMVMLTGLIIAIIGGLLMSPSFVMSLIHNNVTQGVLEGDSVDIPGGYNIFYMIILLLTSYLSCILNMVAIVPMAYLYGAVEYDEQQQMLQEIPMIY